MGSPKAADYYVDVVDTSYESQSGVQSLGCGRGQFRSADGDVPIAMLQRMKPGILQLH